MYRTRPSRSRAITAALTRSSRRVSKASLDGPRPCVTGDTRPNLRPTSSDSALKEKLPVLVLDQGSDFVGQVGMGGQRRVGVDDREGDLPGQRDQVLVPPQGGQLEIGGALLTSPEDGAFTPQLEIDLGQVEPVGRPRFLVAGRQLPVQQSQAKPGQVAPGQPLELIAGRAGLDALRFLDQRA